MKSMQVKFNKTKFGYILMGPQHLVQEARRTLKIQPVTGGNWTVQEMKEEKWLGDLLCSGLSRSVMATIQAR